MPPDRAAGKDFSSPVSSARVQPAACLLTAFGRQHVGDVLLHGAPGQKPVLLEENGDVPGGGAFHSAGFPGLEPGNDPHQGGLAGAGGG